MRIVVITLFSLLLVSTPGNSEEQPLQSLEVSPVRNASVKLAVVPVYPPRALNKKIDGEVTVAFTISRFGRAVESSIMSAQPRKVFEKEVLDTMRYWVFDPARPVNCGTLDQRATQTFRFRHDADPQIEILPVVIEGLPTLPREQRMASVAEIRVAEAAQRNLSQTVNPRGLVPVKRIEPQYPEDALRRGVEGVVSVSFVIEKDGRVSEPVVVDAVRGSVFKGAALRALAQWEFEPSYRDGERELRTGCHEFVFLADVYKRKLAEQEKLRKTNMRVFEK